MKCLNVQTDNVKTGIEILSQNIPGTRTVLVQMNSHINNIYPTEAGATLVLDALALFELTGSSIWIIYAYLTERKMANFVCIVVALILKVISKEEIEAAIAARKWPTTNRMQDICNEVHDHVPEFNFAA
ncbi:hypothetical protein PV783_34125 [Chitinophaga sp. CC14]|uniref:hypothetical protein n=1 Tax=Chitinophaga sp. CC14 TaxID=3029199 RepID=UPI003B7F99D9